MEKNKAEVLFHARLIHFVTSLFSGLQEASGNEYILSLVCNV